MRCSAESISPPPLVNAEFQAGVVAARFRKPVRRRLATVNGAR